MQSIQDLRVDILGERKNWAKQNCECSNANRFQDCLPGAMIRLRSESKSGAHAKLRCEGYADGCPGSKKVAQRSAGHAQLVEIRNRAACGVAQSWERASIRHIIGAWVVAVEDVEHLSEWRDEHALACVRGAADAEVS